MEAVNSVAAHGQSVVRAPRQKARQQPVLAQLGERARGAGQRLHRSVEHVQHDEPDGSRLAEAAEQRRECRSKHERQVLAELLGAENSKPHDWQDDEVDARHRRAGQHRARHVAVGIDRLAHMTGCGLERRRGKADQIDAGHHRRQIAEPAGKGRRQREGRRLPPVDRTGQNGNERGKKRQGGGGSCDRDRQARNPSYAAQVHEREHGNECNCHSLDGKARQVPLLYGRGREQRGEPAGRNPAPPIAGARQRREHGAIGPECFSAGGRNASDPVRPHQDELGPGRRGGPAQEDADNEQGNGGTALPEDVALADEEGGNQKDHLIAAAHRQGGGANPTYSSWMRALAAVEPACSNVNSFFPVRSRPWRSVPTFSVDGVRPCPKRKWTALARGGEHEWAPKQVFVS